MEVLREEDLDCIRYALWDATGRHRDYALVLVLGTSI